LTFDHESFPIGYLAEADPGAWPPELRERARQTLTLAHRALVLASVLGVIGWPVGRKARWPFRRPQSAWHLAQLGVLGAYALCAWQAISSPEHPFWPLVVAIPILLALPLPGRPRTGGVIGLSALAIVTVCLTHAVFFGEDRYHMVLTPLLCLLAACALRRAREEEPPVAAQDAPPERCDPARPMGSAASA
jgi:hypothetical protein